MDRHNYFYDGARVAEEWTVSGGGTSLTASYVYGNYDPPEFYDATGALKWTRNAY